MREILDDVTHWLSTGESVALATVVDAEGSSLRSVGSRMAVTPSGHMAGSVSGGCVEGDVFREAQEVLAGGQPRRLRYSAVDEEGWDVGLACGGTIDVFIEPLVPAHRLLIAALKEGQTVGLATRLDGSGHLVGWPDGRLEGDRDLASRLMPLLDSKASPSSTAEPRSQVGTDILLEVFARPPTLTIVGAVHIAVPLASIARLLSFRVRLVDARRAFATRERFPHVDELVVAWPHEALVPEVLRRRDAVVVLTHDPKFDVPAVEAALKSPVGYVGLLGSSTTQQKRRAMLKDRGFSEEELARVHGPIGLDLGGRRPAEIALAIMAEIVAVQNE